MGKIVNLRLLSEETSVGGTAENLLFLRKKGFQIPNVYILTQLPFMEAQNGSSIVSRELRSELSNLINPERDYAVFRSSEAGGQESFQANALRNKIRGIDRVLQSFMELCRNNNESQVKVKGNYSSNKEPAVLMVEIPPLSLSGLVFTRNPLNGANETIIELIAEKAGSGEIQSQQVTFRNRNLSGNTNDRLLCNLKILERIVAESSSIEKMFRKPVCLEWGYDAEKTIWFNVKLLQSLDGLNVYSNKIARDMLPGIILPLVWSINAPINSKSWKLLITQLIGKNNIDTERMTKQFYYRAYFNMGVFGGFFDLVGMPRETLEIMMLGETHKGSKPKMKMNMRMLKYLPKIGLYALKNLMIAKKINKFLHSQKLLIDSYNIDISGLNEKETWATIGKIEKLSEECAYNVIVVRLVRSFHHTILRMLMKRKGIREDLEFKTDDLKDIDPKYSFPALKKAFDALPNETRDILEKGKMLPQQISQIEFAEKYENFLKKFGNLSTSTVDMSKPQWREKPQFIINMIRNYQETPESDNRTTPSFPESLSGLMLRGFYRNFVDYEKYSLRTGFLYAYGYSLFRKYFLHLGNILRLKGYISQSDDIFYLTKKEIQEIGDLQHSTLEYTVLAEERKKEIEACSDIIVPEVIFGDTPPPPMRRGEVASRLRGLPSSRGYYEGAARVAVTTADYNKILPGDVLIIPYSDASWTPLFAKAGAVISESGGLLSHCSIVAREYRIPAVVAVEGAMKIPDNARIVVDGYTGEILVSQQNLLLKDHSPEHLIT